MRKHWYFTSCSATASTNIFFLVVPTNYAVAVHTLILHSLWRKYIYYASWRANTNITVLAVPTSIIHCMLSYYASTFFFKYRLRNIFFQNLHFTKKFSFSFLNIYTKCVNMSCTHTQYKQSVTLFFYCVQIIMRVKTWLSYSYKDGKLKWSGVKRKQTKS